MCRLLIIYVRDSPGDVLRDIAERKQLVWLLRYDLENSLKQKIEIIYVTPQGTDRYIRLNVQINSAMSGLGTSN